MFPLLVKIGPFQLHTYGLFIALAFLAGYGWARREFRLRSLDLADLDRLLVQMMIFGLFGARIAYFAVNGFADLRSDPLSFFRVWEGGLVFYGGLGGGVAAVALYALRHHLSSLALGDALTAPLLLGQAVGRLGCLAAGCCYGKPTNSALGVVFSHPECLAPTGVALHPTQLYCSAATLALFGGAAWIGRTQLRPGAVVVYYLLSYGIARFFIEFARGDDRGAMLSGFSPSQWGSLVLIAAGILGAIYVYGIRRR